MKNLSLYVVVSVCGAAILALEILGTRLLGPFYGVSLYLWSALISVTLIALSAGYAIGGRLADRTTAPAGRLGLILLCSGVWTILIIFMKHPVLSLFENTGLRTAVLGAAAVLFGPPLTLLAMVSPFAVRMKARRVEEVGRSTGNLSAVSTFASVISALAVGFFLIPAVGVNRLFLIIGGVLIITGCWLVLSGRKRGTTVTIASLVLLAAAILEPSLGGGPGRRDRGLLAVRQSSYGELRVVDTEVGRYLLIDGSTQSLVDTATWSSSFHYAAVMDLPKYFFARPGRALLLGLGGGSLAKQYARDGWHVDAVEIDRGISDLAREYFGLMGRDASLYEMDGREFLLRKGASYDIILMDAFGSGSVPFHLMTDEAFSLVRSRLGPGGIVAVNLEAIGWHDPIVSMVASTMKRHFSEVLALPTEEPPDRFCNVVLLGANRMLDPLREPERNEGLEPDWRYGPGYQKVHAWDNRFTPHTDGDPVLTDDLNPIDLRSETINLEARKILHREFAASGVSW
jgi:spermidine synthase